MWSANPWNQARPQHRELRALLSRSLSLSLLHLLDWESFRIHFKLVDNAYHSTGLFYYLQSCVLLILEIIFISVPTDYVKFDVCSSSKL